MELLSKSTINSIKWRLLNDGATSFSDDEIDRIMSKTCAPTSNAKRAKHLRDCGILKYNEHEIHR
jgi:hypothetical protein